MNTANIIKRLIAVENEINKSAADKNLRVEFYHESDEEEKARVDDLRSKGLVDLVVCFV